MLPALIGGLGVAGLAAFAGWHTMSPTSQLYGRTFIGLEPASRMLALTYDDGPNDPYTQQTLDILERHGVKATFFLIGKFVEQRPDLARAVVEAGHTVGSHTWDHPNLVFSSQAEVRRQLEKTQRAILDATGVETRLFRPPFGGRRPATLRTVRRFGLQPILWSVTCYDWSAKSADSIVEHAEHQIRGGDVILLHDGGHRGMGADRSRTVEATDRILGRYLGEGYRFVTIPEMMEKPPSSSLRLATNISERCSVPVRLSWYERQRRRSRDTMPAQPTTSALAWQETGALLESTSETTTLESVVREHARFVFKVAYSVLRNSHDAEDVAQEVFLRVHRSGTKDVRDLRGWLARIAFRLAIDRTRKPAMVDSDGLEVATTDPNAERVAIHRQRVEQVQKLIAALPDELRFPLVLSAMEELKPQQIAEILEISDSAVRSRIFRARQVLKEKLTAITDQRP